MEKKIINAQIKALRKALKLNQKEFGDKIGLKQGAISKIEQDGNTVTDQNIKLICEKFQVRLEWLTEGTGEMLQKTEDSLFASFAERYELSADDQALTRYLLQLTSEERQLVVQHILEMADIIRRNRQAAKPPAPPAESKKAAAPAMDAAAALESDTNEALPLDPDIEAQLARLRAKLYSRQKTREILTSLQPTGDFSADKDADK